MEFNGTNENGFGEKVIKIFWPESQLNFYCVLKDSGFKDVKAAVYILMDKYRRKFYIGETGGAKGGGVYHRFQSHKYDKKYWDRALVIEDSHGDFSSDSVRRYFEWKLNAIAKARAAEDNVISIESTAGVQDERHGMEKRLREILAVCRFIGVPWAFAGDGDSETVAVLKKQRGQAVFNTEGQLSEFWEAMKSYAKKKDSAVCECLTQKGLEQQWYSVHVGLGKCHIDLGASLSKNWIKIGVVVEKAAGALQQKVLAQKKVVENALGEKIEVGGGKSSLTLFTYHPMILAGKSSWHTAFDWYIEKLPLLTKAVRDIADGNVAVPSWTGVTQLAKAIADKYNNGRAVGHAVEILSGRFPVKSGMWRDIMVKVGIEFDNAGRAVDWKKAKLPAG